MSDNTPPIRVYIENAHDDSLGGFTIPLPTTREVLRPWLEAIEIPDFNEGQLTFGKISSSIPVLEQAFSTVPSSQITFDELNYLAAKISTMGSEERTVFAAALEAEWDNDSCGHLINIMENLGRYDWQPVADAEEYGEWLLEDEKDEQSARKEKLRQSDDPDFAFLAMYIDRLEERVSTLQDPEKYGTEVSEVEQGIFTNAGYIIRPAAFAQPYRGPQDIPSEYRIFTAPGPPLIAKYVDIPAILAALHCTVGEHTDEMLQNLDILDGRNSTEYLLYMGEAGAFITEAAHAYREDTGPYLLWTHAQAPADTAFAIHLTDVDGRIAGDIAQVDISALRQDIVEHGIQPTGITATLPDGSERVYSLTEWANLGREDKEQLGSWTRNFRHSDYSKVLRHLDKMRASDERICKSVSAPEFLAEANRKYMGAAAHAHPDFLRVAPPAAKEMLARLDADVYLLGSTGPQKLSGTDAVKGGIWVNKAHTFAIRKEDAVCLSKWSDRRIEAISRIAQAQDRKNDPER